VIVIASLRRSFLSRLINKFDVGWDQKRFSVRRFVLRMHRHLTGA